jgi:hypothetical protein
MGALDLLIDLVRDLRDRVRLLEQQETPFEAGLLPPSAGGTGVDNGSFTLTLGASVSLSTTPAPANAKYIVQTSDGTLTNEQALGSLSTGLLKNTTSTGVLSIATASDLPDHASNHGSGGADPITIAASQIGSGTIATARLGSGTASASTLLWGDNTWAALVAGDLPTHTHAAGDITSGTIATARLGSGTASASTLLWGDNTWAALVAGDLPSHTHAAGDITSGTIGTARLGTGTANSAAFLRGDNVWSNTLSGNIGVTAGNGYFVGGTQVVAARRTGWSAATGTATRSSYATSTVTTAQLAERVKALIDDLIAHGALGA